MYNISSLVGGVINPYMISTTAWGWAGKAGFFWGGMAFLGTVWAYFRLPEMRGRSFRELDILFGMCSERSEMMASTNVTRTSRVGSQVCHNRRNGERRRLGASRPRSWRPNCAVALKISSGL